VSLGGDQGRAIDHQAIGLDLAGKAFKGVCFRLDLNAPDVAVDHCDIDPRCAVGQSKFLENQRVVALLGMRQQSAESRRPKIPILQLCWHGYV